MIDIQSELDEFNLQFISILDLIEHTKKYTKESNNILVSKWLLKRLSDFQGDFPELLTINKYYKFEPVYPNGYFEIDLEAFRDVLSDVVKHGTLPHYNEPPFEDDDWNCPLAFDAGFKRNSIETVFPFLGDPYFSSRTEPFVRKEIVEDSADSVDFKLEGFAGKDTALMLIAGLAVALEKTSDRFKRGAKINQSSVIAAAEQALNSYGSGVKVTDRALRNWLRLALKAHSSKLDD